MCLVSVAARDPRSIRAPEWMDLGVHGLNVESDGNCGRCPRKKLKTASFVDSLAIAWLQLRQGERARLPGRRIQFLPALNPYDWNLHLRWSMSSARRRSAVRPPSTEKEKATGKRLLADVARVARVNSVLDVTGLRSTVVLGSQIGIIGAKRT